MEAKTRKYLTEQLASCGFAVLSPDVAFQLRPDVWASRTNVGSDFNTSRAKTLEVLGGMARVQVLEVLLDGDPQWRLCATRSCDDLGRRVEHVTGILVAAIRELERVAEVPRVAALAPDDQPPAHQCEARRRWFENHDLRDPNAIVPKRLPLRDQRFAS